MPEIKAILFDLDGTLTDSALDLSISVNHVLSSLGFPEQPVDAIYGYIGRGLRNMLLSALGQERENELERAIVLFRAHYWDHCLDNTKLYPGAEDTLKKLKDFRLAVITNKSREFAVKILKGLGVLKQFDLLIGGDDSPALKPSPEPLLLACKTMGVRPETAVMVGDSVTDIISAIEARALPCGVTYGLGSKSELSKKGAKWLIDSLDELPPLVSHINSSLNGM
jgi:phosphoglycolate phosphatase